MKTYSNPGPYRINRIQPVRTRSLLETDLYKFSMWQCLLHSNPANHAVYEFVCRNKPGFPLAELKDLLEEQLEALCAMSFKLHELDYLRTLGYLKSDFIDFLSVFRFQRRFIKVWTEGENLRVRAEGPQVHVMGFEIYVLYLVSELYFDCFDQEAPMAEAERRLDAKVVLLNEFREEQKQQPLRHLFELSDFGLRRRYSAAMQDKVVARLVKEAPDYFRGTSNVYLAEKFGLTPIGTMAHEFLQSFMAVEGVRLRDFQKAALEAWVQEFRGDLGTALTDVVGMDAFLNDFDRYFALLYEGLRHDSGDPFVWGEKALAHYAKMRVDAHTKRLTWSDGLDLPRAFSLYRTFGDRVRTGFGVGTNLTNDTGLEPLNLVMKLMYCNGQPVAKLSDSPGKTLCTDETFLAYLRQVFNHHI